MATPLDTSSIGAHRGRELREEQVHALRISGWQWISGTVSGLMLLVLPGVTNAHWRPLLAVAAFCLLIGFFVLLTDPPAKSHPAVWHVVIGVGYLTSSITIACTGGASSPARFFVFMTLSLVAYFHPRKHALPWIPASIGVIAFPLVYDTSAIPDGYLGELAVIAPTYVFLALMIMKGKDLLVSLREEAVSLSLHDPLTGLSNRRGLLDFMQSEVRPEHSLGLILVDLDGFKDVNTIHGYHAGDDVLVETARTLERCVRRGTLVARLGGDEFAVLCPSADAETMDALSTRILTGVRGTEERLGYHDVVVSASVGCAMYPHDAQSIDELISVADECLRAAEGRQGPGPLHARLDVRRRAGGRVAVPSLACASCTS